MTEPRRYLLMKSGYEVNVMFIDGHGTCDHIDSEGSLFHTRWHHYRDSKGLREPLLCPNGLEEREWSRVFTDDPPGSWTAQYTAYKQSPPKRQAYDE